MHSGCGSSELYMVGATKVFLNAGYGVALDLIISEGLRDLRWSLGERNTSWRRYGC